MLKKALLFVVLTICFPLLAQAKPVSLKECDTLGTLSKGIMESRQYGSRKETVLRQIKEAHLGALEAYLLSIVDQAYTFPQHETREDKLKEIDKFTALTLAVCMQKKMELEAPQK